jgi:hypothetical protein
MDSRMFAEETIAAMQAGEFVSDSNEMKREPVLRVWASIEADKKAVRELLRQSLDCCAVLPSGKLEVLEKDRLADLHKQADELRKRAAHNEAVLDRFDAAHIEALATNPTLEPSLFALQQWKKSILSQIEQGKNVIRVTSATWLMSTEGANHTAETIKNHPRVAREVQKYEPIIAAAEEMLPIATAHLEKAQTILGEAILPGKVNILPAKNEFNQAINRATAL